MLYYCHMDAKKNELLQKVLRDNGYSLTKARKLIIDTLWGAEPQSTNELIDKLQSEIDRASLYRNVTLFEKLGLIQRVYIGWKYKIELSDVFSDHHHHISCLRCGKIKAIHEEDEVENLIHSIANRYGISAERHQLEIQGVCQECQKSSPVQSL